MQTENEKSNNNNTKDFKTCAFGLVRLTRPIEWSKTFLNMIFGAVFALGTAFAVSSLPNLLLFFWGFIITGPLLWGGQYMLNDWTDRENDKHHPTKKKRAIASGAVPPNVALFTALLLIFGALALAFTINLFFFIVLSLMFINQSLYTLHPFRLKERKVVDLISGSVLNPLFRFLAGWTLFAPVLSFENIASVPWIIVAMFVLMQFGGYTLYRMSGRKVEEKLGYKSSVVAIKRKKVLSLAYSSLALGIVLFILSCIIGPLKLHFLALLLLAIPIMPFMSHSAKNPEEVDIEKAYYVIYVPAVIFIIGFLTLYILT
ncbi:MAG: UbiA family prenyltransferase [Candidatus Diapherotrites archaeon]|nr:UbiA family prenyltransferase [Candidatus Diapherotrites archaeon]